MGLMVSSLGTIEVKKSRRWMRQSKVMWVMWERVDRSLDERDLPIIWGTLARIELGDCMQALVEQTIFVEYIVSVVLDLTR